MPSVEIKLKDVPETGYFSTNDPPQGEVLIRGGSVISGYYKRDDLNNDEQIFTKDGWLRTGDVGQFNADGTITLVDRYVIWCRNLSRPITDHTDRIKNLVKLQGGEVCLRFVSGVIRCKADSPGFQYIALERLESIYKACDLVSNICVHASPDAKQPIAIIIPHESHLRHALEANPIPGADSREELHVLCGNTKVSDYVMAQCNALGKKNGFKPMEILEAVILSAEDWTPQNGLVTAAQKVQRKRVAEAFDAQIKVCHVTKIHSIFADFALLGDI